MTVKFTLLRISGSTKNEKSKVKLQGQNSLKDSRSGPKQGRLVFSQKEPDLVEPVPSEFIFLAASAFLTGKSEQVAGSQYFWGTK